MVHAADACRRRAEATPRATAQFAGAIAGGGIAARPVAAISQKCLRHSGLSHARCFLDRGVKRRSRDDDALARGDRRRLMTPERREKFFPQLARCDLRGGKNSPTANESVPVIRGGEAF